MRKEDKVILYTDGASSGNPGRAGVGILLFYNKKLIKKISRFIGIATNNVAEYMALIYGLEEALYLRAKDVDCFLDSQLLVRQLEGSYKVRDEKLKLFYSQVDHLKSFFRRVNFNYIRREENKEADILARKGSKGKRE
ncbi:MAG: ribonuclease HI family protein [Candidatus Aerophobetes bacterium]|nr:ribonuclease HI family protein [Candidatus Aerophobetes bacterium]